MGAFGGCGKGKWSPKSRGGQWGERNTRAKHFRDHTATQALRRRCSRGRKSQAEALIKDLKCRGDIPLLRHLRAARSCLGRVHRTETQNTEMCKERWNQNQLRPDMNILFFNNLGCSRGRNGNSDRWILCTTTFSQWHQGYFWFKR